MAYKVVITSHFIKQLKPLVRKFRHLTSDVEKTLQRFDKSLGTPIGNYTYKRSLQGRRPYKIRLKSSDLKRGKSKSFRLIVFVVEYANILTPVVIYFKGERENVSKQEISYHLSKVIQELESNIQ